MYVYLWNECNCDKNDCWWCTHILTALIPLVCGRHITRPNGTLASPGYPGNYPSNADCIWVISAPQRHHIELEFKRFDIHKVGRGCRYDYVEVRDGNSRDSPSLGRHCGKSGNKMKYYFTNLFWSRKSLDRLVGNYLQCLNKENQICGWSRPQDKRPGTSLPLKCTSEHPTLKTEYIAICDK